MVDRSFYFTRYHSVLYSLYCLGLVQVYNPLGVAVCFLPFLLSRFGLTRELQT